VIAEYENISATRKTKFTGQETVVENTSKSPDSTVTSYPLQTLIADAQVHNKQSTVFATPIHNFQPIYKSIV